MVTALYAEFTALSGAEDRVAELLGILVDAVRREPGNVVFDAYRVTGELARFFVYEVYASDEAFQNHLAADHGRIFNTELAELVEGGVSRLTWLSPVREQ